MCVQRKTVCVGLAERDREESTEDHGKEGMEKVWWYRFTRKAKMLFKCFSYFLETFFSFNKTLERVTLEPGLFLSDNSARKELLSMEKLTSCWLCTKERIENSKENKAGANLYLLPGKPPVSPRPSPSGPWQPPSQLPSSSSHCWTHWRFPRRILSCCYCGHLWCYRPFIYFLHQYTLPMYCFRAAHSVCHQLCTSAG